MTCRHVMDGAMNFSSTSCATDLHLERTMAIPFPAILAFHQARWRFDVQAERQLFDLTITEYSIITSWWGNARHDVKFLLESLSRRIACD
jgi:hypothetical protein